MTRYKAHEVASQISPREFISLCSFLDEHYGAKLSETNALHGGGAAGVAVKTIGARRTQVKFDVLKIERSTETLMITVDMGGGAVAALDILKVMKLQARCVETGEKIVSSAGV